MVAHEIVKMVVDLQVKDFWIEYTVIDFVWRLYLSEVYPNSPLN